MIDLGSFPRIPNRADWAESVEVLDNDTGTPLPLDDWLIEMEIVDQDGCRHLYGSTADGIVSLNSLGFEFLFPAASMKQLRDGSYTVYILFTDSETGAVREPVIANLPIIEGGSR